MGDETPLNFLPYGCQSITDEDVSAVVEVLRSPFLTQGPMVPRFEKSVAQIVGANYAVAVNSATSALHLACLALGLSNQDWLWTTPITFVASANCGRYCGAKVDFVDIDSSTGLMSVQSLQEKLEKAEKLGTLPKVVVPVHLAGASCDLAAIERLSQRYGFFVVEDASHAIGGSYLDNPVGNCRFSSISVFSFHPVKIITSAEGGMATTNDPELAKKLVTLRSHGIIKDPKYFKEPPQGEWSYEQQLLGFNYRLNDIQAALGLSQLNRLELIVKERNYLLNLYQESFKDLPIDLLKIPEGVRSSVHLCIIRLLNSKKDFHRRVFQEMRSAGIGVQLHYSPVHLQPYYRNFGYKEGDFPLSERYATQAMSIPLFPGLKEEDQLRVVKALSTILHQESERSLRS